MTDDQRRNQERARSVNRLPRHHSEARRLLQAGLIRGLVVLSGIGVLLSAVSTGAQPVSLTPRTIQIDRLTCAELLAEQGQTRDRLLIYLNGYINGVRGQKVWDEKVEGARIEQAVTECKAASTKPVLDVLRGLWPR
jgi:hypothetical protein